MSETFIGLNNAPRDQARYAILPVPYEGTVCFLPGTAAGPEQILRVSPQMEELDEETRTEYAAAGIETLGPLGPADTPSKQMDRVAEAIAEILDRGQIPLMLGGEHSITAGAFRAVLDRDPEVTVLQLDAHADLRDEYTGGKYSHASVMRRISEQTDRFVQVGIRSFSPEELAECPDAIDRIITPSQIREDLAGAIETICSRLGQTVYLTIDVDVFDPAAAPGVGTPEPGGLDWFQVTAICRAAAQRSRIVAADIVETRPIPHQVTTEFLASRLLGKLIAYTSA